MLADLLLSQFTDRSLPSLQAAANGLAAFVTSKLDRSSRTITALKVRGGLVVLILLPILYVAGLLVNKLMLLHSASILLAVAVLVPVLGPFRTLKKLSSHDASASRGRDQFIEARRNIAAATLHLCAWLVPAALYWCLGGFALLLPYMLLTALMQQAERRRSGYADSPFYTVIALLYELVTVPVSVLTAMLLALAHFFVPKTNLGVFAALFPRATYGPASRYFPLNVIAVGLGLSLEAEIGTRTGRRKLSDKDILWIGPADGRAKLQPKDVKRAWLVLIIGHALTFLILIMALSLLLVFFATG